MKVDLNEQYLFFSVHFVEEKTFSSRLEICLQMSTKMSQNAPEVVHFIKNFLGGMPPAPPQSICSLNRSRNSHPSLFFPFAVLISEIRVSWAVISAVGKKKKNK